MNDLANGSALASCCEYRVIVVMITATVCWMLFMCLWGILYMHDACWSSLQPSELSTLILEVRKETEVWRDLLFAGMIKPETVTQFCFQDVGF